MDRLIALVLLALMLVLYALDPAPVETMRVKLFDLFQATQPRDVTVRPVTIVDIDEDSLSAYGQWPWPRTLLADLVDALFDHGAVVVALDMVFPEADRMNPDNLAAMLPLDRQARLILSKQPSNDAVLAGSIRGRRVVVGRAAYGVAGNVATDVALNKTVAVKRTADAPAPEALVARAATLIRNIEPIEAAAAGHGFVSLLPEADGIVRRVPVVLAYQEALYPALAVEMLRVAFGRPLVVLELDRAGVTRLGIAPGLSVPTDGEGRVWPHFSQRDPAKYVSAGDVLSGAADAAMVAGKLVLIGTSAFALGDIRATPVARAMPGVEIHAQIIENAVTGAFLLRPNYMIAVELTLLLGGGLLMIWLVPRIGAAWTLVLFLAVAGAAGGSAWYLFIEEKRLLDVGYSILAMLLLYTFLTYSGYAKEQAARQRVRDAFAYYLAPAMVEQLAEDPSQLRLGGETRTMSILFCDVRGFTGISESYKEDPAGLTRLINKLLTPLTEIILDRKGTIDKYMGDCIMAFWNAPLDDPAHARNACLAALEMQAAMGSLNERLGAEATASGRRYDPLSVGIGVNSGEVVVGNIGSDQRFDYSVLGDDVNLAARLEGQSTAYGVGLVVGEKTAALAPDLAFLELDRIRVKGKRHAAAVHALVGDERVRSGNAFAVLAAAHDSMLAAYRDKRWTEARHHLATCRRLADGFDLAGVYELYGRRIDMYETDPPPPGWDSVIIATTK